MLLILVVINTGIFFFICNEQKVHYLFEILMINIILNYICPSEVNYLLISLNKKASVKTEAF